MSRTFFDRAQAGNLLHQLWKRCENEKSCDVVLIAGTERKRIPAHRNILSVASNYFDKVLDENTTKEVEMPSLNGNILQSIVEYCYTGRIVISEDIAVELLKTSHMLSLKNVVTVCGNFLADELLPSNCFGLALLAERYHCETLLEKAKDYCLKELLKMYETDEFLSLQIEQISQLLASDDLCVESEEEVFNSLMKWIEHDKSEREQHKAELLKLVRMPLLELSFLIEKVKPFCTTTACLHIYMEAIERQLSQKSKIERRSKQPRSQSQYLMGITLSQSEKKILIHYYSSQEKKWMKWLNSLEYRRDFSVAVMENELFIVGGHDAEGYVLNTAICLNLKTMTLKNVSPMKERRFFCGLAALKGILYAVGGHNQTGTLGSVEKWDPKTNSWAPVASMSANRSSFGIAALNEKLYVVGGYKSNNWCSSAECYDPVQNVWQSIAAMDYCKILPGVAVVNGLLYVVGTKGVKKIVERYDPQTNYWAISGLHPKSNYYTFRCTTLHGKVVVCYNGTIQQYNTETDEWKEITSCKDLNFLHIISYSNKLLTSEFIEN